MTATERPPTRPHSTRRHRASASVTILEAQVCGGGSVLIALSRKHPKTAYVLEHTADGRLACPCPAYQWRGTCAHALAGEKEATP